MHSTLHLLRSWHNEKDQNQTQTVSLTTRRRPAPPSTPSASKRVRKTENNIRSTKGRHGSCKNAVHIASANMNHPVQQSTKQCQTNKVANNEPQRHDANTACSSVVSCTLTFLMGENASSAIESAFDPTAFIKHEVALFGIRLIVNTRKQILQRHLGAAIGVDRLCKLQAFEDSERRWLRSRLEFCGQPTLDRWIFNSFSTCFHERDMRNVENLTQSFNAEWVTEYEQMLITRNSNWTVQFSGIVQRDLLGRTDECKDFLKWLRSDGSHGSSDKLICSFVGPTGCGKRSILRICAAVCKLKVCYASEEDQSSVDRLCEWIYDMSRKQPMDTYSQGYILVIDALRVCGDSTANVTGATRDGCTRLRRVLENIPRQGNYVVFLDNDRESRFFRSVTHSYTEFTLERLTQSNIHALLHRVQAYLCATEQHVKNEDNTHTWIHESFTKIDCVLREMYGFGIPHACFVQEKQRLVQRILKERVLINKFAKVMKSLDLHEFAKTANGDARRALLDLREYCCMLQYSGFKRATTLAVSHNREIQGLSGGVFVGTRALLKGNLRPDVCAQTLWAAPDTSVALERNILEHARTACGRHDAHVIGSLADIYHTISDADFLGGIQGQQYASSSHRAVAYIGAVVMAWGAPRGVQSMLQHADVYARHCTYPEELRTNVRSHLYRMRSGLDCVRDQMTHLTGPTRVGLIDRIELLNRRRSARFRAGGDPYTPYELFKGVCSRFSVPVQLVREFRTMHQTPNDCTVEQVKAYLHSKVNLATRVQDVLKALRDHYLLLREWGIILDDVSDRDTLEYVCKAFCSYQKLSDLTHVELRRNCLHSGLAPKPVQRAGLPCAPLRHRSRNIKSTSRSFGSFRAGLHLRSEAHKRRKSNQITKR